MSLVLSKIYIREDEWSICIEYHPPPPIRQNFMDRTSRLSKYDANTVGLRTSSPPPSNCPLRYLKNPDTKYQRHTMLPQKIIVQLMPMATATATQNSKFRRAALVSAFSFFSPLYYLPVAINPLRSSVIKKSRPRVCVDRQGIERWLNHTIARTTSHAPPPRHTPQEIKIPADADSAASSAEKRLIFHTSKIPH